MDLNSPDTWRWIWLVMAIVFATGELVTPATFFFLPFSVGAAVAAGLAFLGISVGITWAVFLVVSIIAFISLWRLGRKLNAWTKSKKASAPLVGSARKPS